MELWNNSSLLPPPVNTILYSNLNNVEDLTRACNSALQVLSKQSPLHKESAIVSRFLYKFDRKFRNDIGYRILKKINTALKRYLELNLLKDIKNFMDVIPSNFNEDKYLPTRQMLEYVMVRIMSFAKIMFRICVCSKQASIFYMNRIKRGESHWMSLMPYALVCRLWTMTTVLLQHSCSWYSSLFPYLGTLQLKGLDFLPSDYSLPTNLGNWLDITNLENYGRFEWSNRKGIQFNLNFSEDGESNFDTILNYVNDINSENDNTETKQTFALPKLTSESNIETALHGQNVDEGILVSREYFQSFFHKNVKDDKTYNHSADNVTNKITLDGFISKEESYRNENSDLSLTKHLSFMQWQTLKTSLVKLSEMLANNRKIERKFQKIWKEKCLEYL